MKDPLHTSTINIRCEPNLREQLARIARARSMRTSEFLRHELRQIAEAKGRASAPVDPSAANKAA